MRRRMVGSGLGLFYVLSETMKVAGRTDASVGGRVTGMRVMAFAFRFGLTKEFLAWRGTCLCARNVSGRIRFPARSHSNGDFFEEVRERVMKGDDDSSGQLF